MKKFTLLLLFALAFATNTKADVEWTIYLGTYVVGNWDKAYSIPKGILANLENGDMIYGEFTPAETDGEYPQIWNGYNDEDKIDDNPVTESGKFAYTLTSAIISANKDLLIRGKNYTLTKLSVKKAASCIKSTIPLAGTPIVTGNYAEGGSPDFTSLSPVENDYVFVSASTVADDGNGGTINYWKGKLGQGSTWSEELDVNGGYWHKLSSDAATALSGGWAYLQGYYLSITGMNLYHPITSFAIGSIGYATFSADQEVTAPANVTAYKATVNGDYVALTPFTGNVIPANTGAIIAGDQGAVLEFTASATGSTETSELFANTSATDITSLPSGYDYYLLYNNPTGGNTALNLSDLNCGWNSSYNSGTKTITFDGEWKGRGWGWNFDYSDYSKVVVEFESAAKSGALKVQYNYNENYTETADYVEGATSVEIDLNASYKNDISQIYLTSSAASTLTLTAAYLVPNAGSQLAEFRKTTSGTLAANKAYLAIPTGGSARALRVVFGDDDITEINSVEDKRPATIDSDIIYNLSGQVVKNPSRGIYIKNGKKFIVE